MGTLTGFTEEDKKKYVAALNFVATEAKFGDGPTTVAYSIKLRDHFAFLQGMLGKMDALTLEIKKYHPPATSEETPDE